MTNFIRVLSFSIRRWQTLISRSLTSFLKNVNVTKLGTPAISRESCRKYSAFSQHCLSVWTNLSKCLLLTFLAVEIYASSFLKRFSMSFTFIASLFRRSSSSLGLVSLFSLCISTTCHYHVAIKKHKYCYL